MLAGTLLSYDVLAGALRTVLQLIRVISTSWNRGIRYGWPVSRKSVPRKEDSSLGWIKRCSRSESALRKFYCDQAIVVGLKRGKASTGSQMERQ